MDAKTKEKLQAIIEAKKQGNKRMPTNKREIFEAQGESRKGIKQYKKGGLFDK